MKKTLTPQRVIRLESIDSTNNYARELLEKEKPAEGTVIYTRNQYSGRGQGTNYWESEPDKNVTFTIIHYPVFLRIEEQILLNKTLALAVKDYINSIDCRLNVKIKWPNDIYTGNKKIAGMLIENTISGNKFISSISGIGVNINQTQFRSDAPNPTSLKIETEREHDPDECLELILKHIDRRYEELKSVDKEKINYDYLNSLFRLGDFYKYKYNNKIITAKLTGVNDFGRLILLKESGDKIECDVKEVEFVL